MLVVEHGQEYPMEPPESHVSSYLLRLLILPVVEPEAFILASDLDIVAIQDGFFQPGIIHNSINVIILAHPHPRV